MELDNLKDDLLGGRFKEPLVFCNTINGWPASKWSLQSLAADLGSKKLSFRVGKLGIHDVQWETDCQYVEATLGEFAQWEEETCGWENPLSQYSRDAHWLYADYKYMKDVFHDHPQQQKSVQWSAFGFVGRDGADSTMWLGSPGAYTVGHYDTYGCNLVAQIYGRKRWVLFPPSQGDLLYPTRVPYEESSVFSKVHVMTPDLARWPKVKRSTPYVVTLDPGEVLFVPRHWWHFVENLETSCSVNTWLELAADEGERVREAVARLLAFSVMAPAEGTRWLNPTEVPSSAETNITYLSRALAALRTGTAPPIARQKEEPTPEVTSAPQSRDSHKGDHLPVGTEVKVQETNCTRSAFGESPVGFEESFVAHRAPPTLPATESETDMVAGSPVKRGRHESSARVHFIDLRGGGTAYRLQPMEFNFFLSNMSSSQSSCPVTRRSHVTSPDPTTINQHSETATSAQTAGVDGEVEGGREQVPDGESRSPDPDGSPPMGVSRESLLDCVLHPDVIRLIADKVIDKYRLE